MLLYCILRKHKIVLLPHDNRSHLNVVCYIMTIAIYVIYHVMTVVILRGLPRDDRSHFTWLLYSQ